MSFAPPSIPHGRARWALRKTSVFVQINSSFGHGVDLLLRAKRVSRPSPSNHASWSLLIHHWPMAYFLKARLVPADEKLRNQGAEKITGYLRHEALGRFCRENVLAH